MRQGLFTPTGIMNHEAYKKEEYEPRLQIPQAPLQLNLSGVLFTHYLRLYKIYVTEQNLQSLNLRLIAGNIPLASISALILLNLTHLLVQRTLTMSKHIIIIYCTVLNKNPCITNVIFL